MVHFRRLIMRRGYSPANVGPDGEFDVVLDGALVLLWLVAGPLGPQAQLALGNLRAEAHLQEWEPNKIQRGCVNN